MNDIKMAPKEQEKPVEKQVEKPVEVKKEKPVVTPPLNTLSTTSTQISQVTLNTYHEQNPSNWELVPHDKGIEARNTVTGRQFIGSMVEFNKLIRG